MSNDSERKVRKTYEKLDFTVIHKGSPDFLIFKRDKNKNMIDIEFIEVKNGIYDTLTDEQDRDEYRLYRLKEIN